MKVTTLNIKEHEKFLDSLPELKSPNQCAVILFAPSKLSAAQSDQISYIIKKYKDIPVMGCSTAGEINQNHVYDQTISLAFLEFDTSFVAQFSAPITGPAHSFECGQNLVAQIKKDGLRSIFVLADGLSTNGSALVAGINSQLPDGVVVTGGLAGDGADFKSTWILNQNKMSSNIVSALAFYGEDLELYHGSQGGWDLFGIERVVTKSKDNVVYEIDHEPALQLYKKYLGDKSSELPSSGLLFPLQIRSKVSDTKKVVRTILAVDEKDQSITFAGNIPEGSLAQLMRANFNRLIEGASESALSCRDAAGAGLVLAVSCVGRKLVLGERIDEEVEATLDRMPKGSRQIGFYSYGEISPISGSPGCDLHNQTMTLTFIREKTKNVA